jgi:hypothetical protein
MSQAEIDELTSAAYVAHGRAQDNNSAVLACWGLVLSQVRAPHADETQPQLIEPGVLCSAIHTLNKQLDTIFYSQ